MAVPDFQSLMLPLLKIAGDGNEHSTSEAIETLAQQFGLDETDRNEISMFALLEREVAGKDTMWYQEE
jgi:restriction endonuclease Mrr